MKISKKIGLLLAGSAIASVAVVAPIVANNASSINNQVQTQSLTVSNSGTTTVRILKSNLDRALDRINTNEKLNDFLNDPYKWVRNSGVTNNPNNVSSVEVYTRITRGDILGLDVEITFKDGSFLYSSYDTVFRVVSFNESSFRNNFLRLTKNQDSINNLPKLFADAMGFNVNAISSSSKLNYKSYYETDTLRPYNLYDAEILLNEGYCVAIGSRIVTNSIKLSNLCSSINYDIKVNFDVLRNYIESKFKFASGATINESCKNNYKLFKDIKSLNIIENNNWIYNVKLSTYYKWCNIWENKDMQDLGLSNGNYLYVRLTIELTNGNIYEIDTWTNNFVVISFGPGENTNH